MTSEGDDLDVPTQHTPHPVDHAIQGPISFDEPLLLVDNPMTMHSPTTGIDESISDSEVTFVKAVRPPCTLPCPGHILYFTSGQTPHSDYPHVLHNTVHPPWDYTCRNGIMALHSSSCTKMTQGEKACSSCADLESNKTLVGIKHRMMYRVHENAPYAYHSSTLR